MQVFNSAVMSKRKALEESANQLLSKKHKLDESKNSDAPTGEKQGNFVLYYVCCFPIN